MCSLVYEAFLSFFFFSGGLSFFNVFLGGTLQSTYIRKQSETLRSGSRVWGFVPAKEVFCVGASKVDMGLHLGCGLWSAMADTDQSVYV